MSNKKKLVALTGAGISAESGLPTFSGGFMGQYNLEEVASIEGWRRNPEAVQRFYNERRKQLVEVEPNAAHRILAELEQDFDVTVITQNVDNLHERAGSAKIIHLHGELTKARSSLCADIVFNIGYRPIEKDEQAPDGSPLRPHIVWFGEPVPMIDAAQLVVAAADILVVVGSALTVYPAADLMKYANAKAALYLINPEEVRVARRRDVTIIREKATAGMEKLKEAPKATPKETSKILSSDGKTNIFNVIILDQSGSMSSIKQEAINGYNETLQTIKAAQKEHAQTQNHFVTLVVFNGSATRTVYERVGCVHAEELTAETYCPDSNTPLYDAMGTTLTNFRQTLDAETDHRALVTIITDGQENASKEYSGQQIRKIVDELRALGWAFTYIGANHDVEAAAESIGVKDRMKFDATRRGTKDMFSKKNTYRKRYYDNIALKQENVEGKFFEDDEEDK